MIFHFFFSTLRNDHRSKYLRGFFIVDTLSILPLEFIVVLTDSMWYLTSLNLLKILRIQTVIVYSRKLYHVRMIYLHRYPIESILLT